MLPATKYVLGIDAIAIFAVYLFYKFITRPAAVPVSDDTPENIAKLAQLAKNRGGVRIGKPLDKTPEEEQEFMMATLREFYKKHGLKNKEGEMFTYEDTSKTWRLPYSSASLTWEPNKVAAPISSELKLVFKHPEITAFYEDKIIRGDFTGTAGRNAITALLFFLDEHGECSSVPEQSGVNDIEMAIFSKDTKKAYAQITLLEHTINAATEIIELCRLNPALREKATIVAIGHDLGKAPKFYKAFCLLQGGTHEYASVAVMQSIPEVKGLQYWPEIRDAVKSHHHASNGIPLIQLLMEADIAARIKETNKIATTVSDKQPTMPIPVPLPAIIPGSSPAIEQPVLSIQGTDPEVIKSPDTGEPEPPDGIPEQQIEPKEQAAIGKIKPAPYPLPRTKIAVPWLDPETFINFMARYINTNIQGGNKYWAAILFKGMVYFRVRDFVLILEEYSPECKIGITSVQGEANLLYSVVSALADYGNDGNVVATTYLSDHFNAKFLIQIKGQKENTTPYFLIPFYVEPFLNNLLEYEKRHQSSTFIANVESITLVSNQAVAAPI